MVKIYTVGKVMVALSYAPGSFEKYLFYFIQSKSVEYLLEPVYNVWVSCQHLKRIIAESLFVLLLCFDIISGSDIFLHISCIENLYFPHYFKVGAFV